MIDRSDWWQVAYLIALYNGHRHHAAKTQADTAADVADESLKALDARWREMEFDNEKDE